LAIRRSLATFLHAKATPGEPSVLPARIGIDKPPFAPYTHARMIWIAPSEKDAASDNASEDSSADLGSEVKRWFAANKLRNNVAAEPNAARQTAKGGTPRRRREAGRKARQGERGGVHQFGVPPRGNANFAWVQHFIHHLAPAAPGSSGGMAGFVLANGSMSSNQSGDCPRGAHSKTRSTNSQSLGRQRDIRRALIEADRVDTALRDSALSQSEAIPQVVSEAKDNMVALPGQLFHRRHLATQPSVQ
jgi:hypothetical protein